MEDWQAVAPFSQVLPQPSLVGHMKTLRWLSPSWAPRRPRNPYVGKLAGSDLAYSLWLDPCGYCVAAKPM